MNIRECTFPAKHMTFVHVLSLVVRNLMIVTVLLCCGSALLVVICGQTILPMLLHFHAVYWCGLVLSFSLHEYMHCVCFRHAGVQEITVVADHLCFSLSAGEPMTQRDKLFTAVSGPAVCGMTGCILLLLYQFVLQYDMMRYISFIFCFHLINFLPIFGDGKMVVHCLVYRHS